MSEHESATNRLLFLIAQLGDRMNPADHQWAEENAGQTEWELAVDAIREAVHRGELSMTPEEERELTDIEALIRREAPRMAAMAVLALARSLLHRRRRRSARSPVPRVVRTEAHDKDTDELDRP